MSSQFDFFAPAAALPDGMAYRSDFLGEAEEAALVRRIEQLPFAPFAFQGFEGKRRTVSFGMQYRFDGSGLAKAEPMPDWLLPVRARAAELAGIEPSAFVHALIVEYAKGAGIGWHRDRPVFGDVVGISLGAEAPLRFRLKEGSKWRRFTMAAEPRSAYLLTGPARTQWEHSIAPVSALRYSITLRTLR